MPASRNWKLVKITYVYLSHSWGLNRTFQSFQWLEHPRMTLELLADLGLAMLCLCHFDITRSWMAFRDCWATVVSLETSFDQPEMMRTSFAWSHILQHLTPYHYLVIEFQRTSKLPCIFHITKSQIPVISHCKRPSLFNRVLPVSARLDKTTWPQKSQVWPQRLKPWRKMRQSSLIASVS